MIIQVVVFLVERYMYKYPLRLCVFLQIMWLTFAAMFGNVRPVINYLAVLSQTMIDCYITQLLRTKETKDWALLAQQHRQLELSLCELWEPSICPLIIAPCMPFIFFAILHILSGPDQGELIFAACLLFVAGIVLWMTLRPIARISTMWSASVAFKGVGSTSAADESFRDQVKTCKEKHRKRPGSLSIRAVARSFTNYTPEDVPHNTVAVGSRAVIHEGKLEQVDTQLAQLKGHVENCLPEDSPRRALSKNMSAKNSIVSQNRQEYLVFLEYIQGAKYRVMLGFPGWYMWPVTSLTLSSLIASLTVKLPLLFSFFLQISQDISSHNTTQAS